MIKTARILFTIVGCLFPILIGTLHTFAHFVDLLTPEIQDYLQKEIIILGDPQTLWNTWGLVSFMMGASFIVIGILNVSMLRNLPTSNKLPVLSIVAMLFYLFCVIYVGYEYNQAFQFYGGLFGSVLTVLCLVLTMKIEE